MMFILIIIIITITFLVKLATSFYACNILCFGHDREHCKNVELIERWRLLGRLAWSEGTLH